MSTEATKLTAVEVLERFYKEERLYMQAGGPSAGASFDGMASTLDPEVRLYQSPDLPWGGDYVGHAGFREWAARMSDAFDYLDVLDTEFLEKEDKVVTFCRLITRSRRHGNQLDRPMIHVVKVRNGRITEFRPFYWNVPDYVAAASL
jgi:ketosteroid isomerase-like protein